MCEYISISGCLKQTSSVAHYPEDLTVLKSIVIAQEKIDFPLPPESDAATAAFLRQRRVLCGEGNAGDVAFRVLVTDKEITFPSPGPLS